MFVNPEVCSVQVDVDVEVMAMPLFSISHDVQGPVKML